MQKVIRKAPLTLIEVCIALGLMAIVVFTLFSSLIQTVKVSKSLDSIKTNALKLSFCYDRLLPIFSHSDPNLIKLEKDDAETITKVVFSFENGLDPELIYSGITRGSIYCDKNCDLILSINSKDNSMVQSEVLLTNIKKLSFIEELPFFITMKVELSENTIKEFVFFFSDRSEENEAYTI